MLRRKNIVLTLVLAFIMASLSLAGLNTYAAEITIGTNSVLPQSDYNTGNYLMSLKCTLTQPASLSSLSVNIKANPNGKKLSMALYGDVSGRPGQKLAETAPFVPVTGWNTQAVIAPVALPAGNYWIAWYGEDPTLTYAYQPSGGTLCYNDEQTFGVFPETFPDVASLPYNYSLYATLTATSQNVQTLEAESGNLSGGASVMSNTSASGGQSVGNLHYNNASVTLTGVDGGTGGTAAVSLTFSSNDTGASKGLFVNGTKVQTLNFTNTGDWNSFTALTVSVNLNAGLTNTIMVKNDQANGWGVNIDKLVISPQGGTSTPTPTPTATPTPTPTATPVPDPNKLTYAPPELDADFVTYYVAGSGTFEVNPGGKDARIIMPSSVYTGQIYITNAKNVVMIGGAIQMRHGQYDDRTIYIDRDCTGIIHIEGIHITAGEGCEGDGIAIRAPEATVRIQNCRFDNLVGSNLPGRTHSDICQPWGGVLELFADRITASSDYQGFYLQLAIGPIGSVVLKNVNIIGQSRNNSEDTSGGYYLWTDENGANGDSFYKLTVENFWISPRPGDNLGKAVMPEINSNEDLSQVAWNTPNRVGTVYKGIPPEGDFVPLGTAGVNYVSPGYNN